MKLLKKADFSAETDLKERLYKKLFADNVIPFRGREVLNDDDAAIVFAAGDLMAQQNSDKKAADAFPPEING